jgi:hypothetical protein
MTPHEYAQAGIFDGNPEVVGHTRRASYLMDLDMSVAFECFGSINRCEKIDVSFSVEWFGLGAGGAVGDDSSRLTPQSVDHGPKFVRLLSVAPIRRVLYNHTPAFCSSHNSISTCIKTII